MNMPELLTTNEILKVLRVSRSKFCKVVLKDPSFPLIKLGKNILVKKESLLKWIDSKESETK